MTYHRFVTRLTRHMSLVEQELLTLPEFMSSPPIPVTRSLVLSCVVCPLVLFFWPLCSLFFFDIRILITFCIFKLFLLCLSQFVMLNHKFTFRGNDMDITCTRSTKERGIIYKERSIKHLSPFFSFSIPILLSNGNDMDQCLHVQQMSE